MENATVPPSAPPPALSPAPRDSAPHKSVPCPFCCVLLTRAEGSNPSLEKSKQIAKEQNNILRPPNSIPAFATLPFPSSVLPLPHLLACHSLLTSPQPDPRADGPTDHGPAMAVQSLLAWPPPPTTRLLQRHVRTRYELPLFHGLLFFAPSCNRLRPQRLGPGWLVSHCPLCPGEAARTTATIALQRGCGHQPSLRCQVADVNVVSHL